MININFGKNKGCTENRFISSYFISKFDSKWFNDPIVKRLLLSVHNTEYVGDQMFKSDWFKSIPAEKISTGVQCAILLMKYQKEDREFYPDLIDIGENLYPFIMEYAKDNEIYVGTSLDDLYLSDEDFTFRCTNDNKVYHTLDDLYELNFEHYIKYELEEIEEFEREEEEYYLELEKNEK